MDWMRQKYQMIRTVEMHTGGEPTRIVLSGLPNIDGDTVIDKRRYCRNKLDRIRKMLMAEPRGHFDMFGAFLVPADHPEADTGAIYINNEGYSTMCGHATMAIIRLLVDSGVVKRAAEGDTEVKVQAPCGLLRTWLTADNFSRFHSVPSFVQHRNLRLPLPEGGGECRMDICYGGASYALVRRQDVGFSDKTSKEEYIRFYNFVRRYIVKADIRLTHPEHSDLALLHGLILADFAPLEDTNAPLDEDFRHIVVFADGSIDRSPCGSGTTACCALLHATGRLPFGHRITTRSIVGSEFRANIHAELDYHGIPAVTVQVEGRAHYTGQSEFMVEEDDPFAEGFTVE